jgi:hypothetical protein
MGGAMKKSTKAYLKRKAKGALPHQTGKRRPAGGSKLKRGGRGRKGGEELQGTSTVPLG